MKVSVRGDAWRRTTDALRPKRRGDSCDALNGCVCEATQDVSEVVADRDLEPSTAFHNREDGGYARPSLFASDVDPVGAANCDRAHGIFGKIRAQFQLWIVVEEYGERACESDSRLNVCPSAAES